MIFNLNTNRLDKYRIRNHNYTIGTKISLINRNRGKYYGI